VARSRGKQAFAVQLEGWLSNYRANQAQSQTSPPSQSNQPAP
jgi:hypothetical protein